MRAHNVTVITLLGHSTCSHPCGEKILSGCDEVDLTFIYEQRGHSSTATINYPGDNVMAFTS